MIYIIQINKFNIQYNFNIKQSNLNSSMSTHNIQPPKLNYAKGRNKSKNKFDIAMQQKKSIQASSQTDIFAHLNQDNLNYIKKQLKHKKNININNQQKNQQKEKNQIQSQKLNKFQNLNQTEKQIQVNIQSKISPIQSSQVTFASQHQQEKQKWDILQKKQDCSQVKPLQSFQNKNIQNEQNEQNHKIFQNYELRSQQNSQSNQFRESIRTIQGQLSETGSIGLKGSQFIDYLQSYIVELNTTPQKNKINKNEQIRRGDFYKKKSKELQKQRLKQQIAQTYRSIKSQKYKDNEIIDQIDSDKNNDNKLSYLELMKQLEKEKFYSVTLACELHKYKQNEHKNNREIQILNDKLKIITKQTHFIKQTLKQEINKNQQIQTKIQYFKQKTFKNIKNIKSNQNSTKKHSKLTNHLNQIIDFSTNNPIYNSLNPQFHKKLLQNYQKGQNDYKKDCEVIGKQNIGCKIMKKVYMNESQTDLKHKNQQDIVYMKKYNKLSESRQGQKHVSRQKKNSRQDQRRRSLQKIKYQYQRFQQNKHNLKYK